MNIYIINPIYTSWNTQIHTHIHTLAGPWPVIHSNTSHIINVRKSIYIQDLLERLTCCGPTTAVYQCKDQEFSSYSVHETGYFSWSSVYARILRNGLANESKQTKKANFLLMFFVYRLPAEDVAHIRGGSLHLKTSGLKGTLPAVGSLTACRYHLLAPGLLYYIS